MIRSLWTGGNFLFRLTVSHKNLSLSSKFSQSIQQKDLKRTTVWRSVRLNSSASTELNKESQNASPSAIPTYKTQEDTIAAVATGFQRCAVGIIRVSGIDAVSIARQVFRPRTDPAQWSPSSHRIYVGDAVNSQQDVLDEVLCLVFLSPKSYTGEDVVEIHCHGGTVCVQRVITACIEAGARPARPGEFTLRAFLNGKLDLSQAESVSQLVDARTVGAADSALAGLKGGVGEMIERLRSTCLDILAELEARLDFDEDMPGIDLPHLQDQIRYLQEDLESCLRTASHGRLLRTGIQVAIVGRPNVGKSSLMNAWAGVDKALVTEIPGTTRDVVEADLSIKGVLVKLLDTAGIRKGIDKVEQMGIERAAATAKGADLIIMVMDLEEGWTDQDALVFSSLWSTGITSQSKKSPPGILVANKTDKTQKKTPSLPIMVSELMESVVLTSAKKKSGLEDLDKAVLKFLGEDESRVGGMAWAVNERQSEALFRAYESLGRLTESIESSLPLDCWTIDLREALLALGEVNGEDLKEEILDNIFNRFCIDLKGPEEP